MAGTNDTITFAKTTVANRLEVFPALPPGDKYELVLEGGEHFAFSDQTSSLARNQNPNHHPIILALSTAFWDGHLQSNLEALAWLKSNGPRTLMGKKDRWQFK